MGIFIYDVNIENNLSPGLLSTQPNPPLVIMLLQMIPQDFISSFYEITYNKNIYHTL